MSFHLVKDGNGWRLYEHLEGERSPNWTIATFPYAAKHNALHWASIIVPEALIEVEE